MTSWRLKHLCCRTVIYKLRVNDYSNCNLVLSHSDIQVSISTERNNSVCTATIRTWNRLRKFHGSVWRRLKASGIGVWGKTHACAREKWNALRLPRLSAQRSNRILVYSVVCTRWITSSVRDSAAIRAANLFAVTGAPIWVSRDICWNRGGEET